MMWKLHRFHAASKPRSLHTAHSDLKNVSFSIIKVNQKAAHVYFIVFFWTLSNSETLVNSSHFRWFLGNFDTWKPCGKCIQKSFWNMHSMFVRKVVSHFFRLQGIKICWRLQFLESLRTSSLRFQKARTKIDVILTLLCWLSQFRWDSQQGRDRKTSILFLVFWNLKPSNTNETLRHTPLWPQNWWNP